MKEAFGYLRVSGFGQVNRDGPIRQRAAITAYCRAHGLKVKQWFEEEGVSGTVAGEERPAWQSMITELLADGVKIVIIEKLDRFARDLMVQENMLGDLRKNGFELISTLEPDLCSDEPTRKLVRQIMGSIAEYDKSMLVIKLRASRIRKRAAQGWCEGRKRFGTRPGELQIINRMKELRAQGLSFAKVAEVLNAEGLKPSGGNRWYFSSVQQTLKHAS